MSGEIALYSGAGTLVVALSYVMIKRLARSNCSSHTTCCECESPAVELAKKQTERIEHLIDIIKADQPRLKDHLQSDL